MAAGEYVTLMGAEQVAQAAGRMSSAASDMQRAAGQIEAAFEQHQRFMTDWLQQFEAATTRPDPGLVRGPYVEGFVIGFVFSAIGIAIGLWAFTV